MLGFVKFLSKLARVEGISSGAENAMSQGNMNSRQNRDQRRREAARTIFNTTYLLDCIRADPALYGERTPEVEERLFNLFEEALRIFSPHSQQ